MNDSRNDTHVLSSDEMWAKAAQNGPVSKEELGIKGHQSTNGVTSLNEGIQRWTFGLNNSQSTADK